MKVFHSKAQLQLFLELQKHRQASTAFVPTMGALHSGHTSLIHLAKRHAHQVITSIFINPTQFTAGEDFTQYPKDLESDLSKLQAAGTDVVFCPTKEDMYAVNSHTQVTCPHLSKQLCGKSRPHHFSGVLTIIMKFINLIRPNYLVLGQKDYQQVALIKNMISDLFLQTEILTAPIVREGSGLAMSSRNRYLSQEEKSIAPLLYQSLQQAQQLFKTGEQNSEKLLVTIKNELKKSNLISIDYIELREKDLSPYKEEQTLNPVLLVAVLIGKTRLIDNVILSKPRETPNAI